MTQLKMLSADDKLAEIRRRLSALIAEERAAVATAAR